MADFCRACAAELFDVTDGDNDLIDPQNRPGWWWLLCEGCGLHRFDTLGRRLCTAPPEGLPRTDHVGEPVTLDPCTACCYIGGLLPRL